jgi:hypothetical protein
MCRDAVLMFAPKLLPCVVAMEACCGAHDLGRIRAVLLERGLIVPQGAAETGDVLE